MLVLPVKGKWFNMELSGEKPEEYREIKPYWTIRILNWLGYPKSKEKEVMEMLARRGSTRPREVLFRNGYSAKAPNFLAMCTVRIGTGREEWGAEKDRRYYVFAIHDMQKEGDRPFI